MLNKFWNVQLIIEKQITIINSETDKLITNKKQASKLMDIQVSDHIILSSDGYYSFTDEGIS